MTTKSTTFGHAAVILAAPIEDALTSLIQARGVSIKRQVDAMRLLREHLRLRVKLLNQGKRHLNRAVAIAEVLIAADVLAALLIDPMLLRNDGLSELIDVYGAAGTPGGADREEPILDREVPRTAVESPPALVPCELEMDAARLAAWADIMARRTPLEHYGARPQDAAAFVLDTLLAAYREERLPHFDKLSKHVEIVSLRAAIFGYQLNIWAAAGSRLF
jgi:hypothetical protein